MLSPEMQTSTEPVRRFASLRPMRAHVGLFAVLVTVSLVSCGTPDETPRPPPPDGAGFSAPPSPAYEARRRAAVGKICTGDGFGTNPGLADAIQELTAIIDEVPRWTSPYHDRSLARLWNCDGMGALADCSEQLRLDPEHSRFFLSSRAEIRWYLGDFEGALKDYAGSGAAPGWGRAGVLQALGRWEEARDVWKRQIPKDLGDEDLMLWIARCKVGERYDADAELAARPEMCGYTGLWPYFPIDVRPLFLNQKSVEAFKSSKGIDTIPMQYYLGMKLSLDGNFAEARIWLTKAARHPEFEPCSRLALSELRAIKGR